MEVKVSGQAEVTITGNIKSIDDYMEIRNVVKGLVDNGKNEMVVNIPDSITMTSSVVGFFLKLIAGDKVKVTMKVKDERLYRLLDVLNLLTLFDVKKM